MTLIKHDEGKTRLGLIAPDFLEVVGRVLTYGAKVKYKDWNWAQGTKWSRFYDSALRHINAWGSGETLDDETGLPHLAHAACCLMFLIVYDKRGLGTDDRWIPPTKQITPGALRDTLDTIPLCPECNNSGITFDTGVGGDGGEMRCPCGIIPVRGGALPRGAPGAITGKWVDLFCPFCQARHVDAGEWAQRLHHTHLCLACGEEWTIKDRYLFGRAEVCEGCGNARGHAASAACPGYKAHCEACGGNTHNTDGLMCPKRPQACPKRCGRRHAITEPCPKD